MLKNLTVQEFISELASKSPAPGGGSTAALSAALGAALTSMVCNLTIGKKKYADVSEELSGILEHCELLRARLVDLIDKDTEAFNQIMAAYQLPKETPEEKANRDEAIQKATLGATLTPLEVMHTCLEVLKLTDVVARKGNPNSISDAGCAALQLMAGARGAHYNVLINLSGMTNEEKKTEIGRIAKVLLNEVASVTTDIRRYVESVIPT